MSYYYNINAFKARLVIFSKQISQGSMILNNPSSVALQKEGAVD